MIPHLGWLALSALLLGLNLSILWAYCRAIKPLVERRDPALFVVLGFAVATCLVVSWGMLSAWTRAWGIA